MSLLNITGKSGTPLTRLVQDLTRQLREGGSEFTSEALTSQIVSLESLDAGTLETLSVTATSISDTLKNSFKVLASKSDSLGLEDLNSQQLEAATMAALAGGNPTAYAKAALANVAQSSNGIPVISAESFGSAGALDYREDGEYSAESFDNKKLSDMIPYSIVFNAKAARQDEFSETFYPTIVVSPENGGLDITVDRTTIFNGASHNTNGDAVDWDQRNLIEAVTDASILADDSTDLVPFIQPDDSNLDKFVAPAAVAPSFRTIAGVSIKTAPLVLGKTISLLGISQHPELGAGGAAIMDNTDALDSRIFMKKLYLNLPDAGGDIVFKFDVSRLPRNSFNKSVEGKAREMDLNFATTSLVFNEDTLAVDGSAPAPFQPIRDNKWKVRLSTRISGSANLEFGNVQIHGTPIEVLEIVDVDGAQVAMDAGAGLALVTAIAGVSVIGYDIGARRTNSNRRSRGLVLNNIAETERFAIPLGAPISAPSPVGSDSDTRDLDSLVAGARIRNSNNAVTTLLNYADSLRAFVVGKRLGHGSSVIEGVGRHVVVPFFEEVTIDISTAINSIRTKDKAEDIQAVLVNAIRDVSYRMYRNSGYKASMEAASDGAKKPTLLIGTDTILQRHIMVHGDNRTAGIAFEEVKVATTLDARMDGKIVLTLSREGSEGTPDPLSFGCHAWVPELTSSIVVNRGGSTHTESMVQPRSRHINNLPIMAIINVTGLEDVMTDKI